MFKYKNFCNLIQLDLTFKLEEENKFILNLDFFVSHLIGHIYMDHQKF